MLSSLPENLEGGSQTYSCTASTSRQQDSLHLHHSSYPTEVYSLDAVAVTADRGVIVSRRDTVKLLNASDVSEALARYPGLYVNDNGGFAGLKTVSLRGMGSAHTTIYIDGVRVGNVQSGQQDLGMLDFQTLGCAVVDYAQNSISFTTQRPTFSQAPVSVGLKMYAGSFGTYLPSARLSFRLSDTYSLSASASGVFSKGDFKCPDGTRRTNNDLSQVRAGIDLWGLLSGGDLHVKAYYNDASRGTPGSLSWPSADRQHDRNAFVQGLVRKSFGRLYSLKVSAKGSYDDIYYTSSYGDSRYGQTEMQVNSAHTFRLNDSWTLSAAADLGWDGLNSSNYKASRTSLLTVAGASYHTDMLTVNAAMEYAGAFDRGAQTRHSWSPSLDLRVRAFRGLDVVAFGRRAYRVPTFNELYYVGFGNPMLRPEDAWLADVGLEYSYNADAFVLNTKLNGFYNFITDKITSAPTPEDPNIWAPYNIGKVRTTGLDAMLGVDYSKGHWKCSGDARYSYLSAIDKETLAQVPYTARHVVSLTADASWKTWALNAIWQMRSGRSDGYGSLPDWNTLDATFAKSFMLTRAGTLAVKVSVRNILDCRYETVSGYPMPGRSIIGGVEYRF